jgi:eukaryotic-like serine/threonine-protein kinase
LASVRADCLEEDTVLGFLGGTLPPDTRADVEAHVAACSACANLVTWAAADQGSGTIRLAGHEGRPFVGQLHPGARVGRYQILGAVGRGGMGEVYAAYHPDLDRRIALKVVQGFDGSTGERRMRLLREARAIARLSHPNVVTVHDAGTFGDRVFIAMELIDGTTIDEWLCAEARTWQQIVDVFIAAGRGLAAAHAAGVVHRDFKPQNVMIRKDGAVRVMDFGLAHLAEEDASEAREASEDEPTRPIGVLTKTGAFIGTPAYMSPEQFRREAIDVRSDQFSFCVALHEALFGTRPTAAWAAPNVVPGDSSKDSPRPGVPGWLRSIVLRGASADREQRFRSLEELIGALERGRTRLRRHISVAAAGCAVLLLSVGGWRLAHRNRIECVIPQDRVSGAWSGETGDPRRESIHRAFAASRRATAETSWERLSKVLDEYVRSWSAMYLKTCEATHVRGEQSAEVLDLRMSCLNDNLDQVRALTDALMAADGTAVSRAVSAAKDLTPISRCADVALLKSTVPLPKDERTLREVQAMKTKLRDLQALRDTGDFGKVLKGALILRPKVEALAYKPLLAELLELIGWARVDVDVDASEAASTLREALLTAAASRDDLDAAKAASGLSYVLGYRLGKLQDAEFFFRLAIALLDRNGPGDDRIRAWALGAFAGTKIRQGDYESARALMQEATALKVRSLGMDHPDVALTLAGLAYALVECGQPEEALEAANQALDIFVKHGDPGAFQLAQLFANQGDALNALGRYEEAESAFRSSLRIFREQWSPRHPESAYTFRGLAAAKINQGESKVAVPLLEEALQICEGGDCDPVVVGDANLALARALWESRGDRARARLHGNTALKVYREARSTKREQAAKTWLVAHRER